MACPELAAFCRPVRKRIGERQSREDATDFIIEMIERYGKELYWVTSGPMTDIARVLRKDPHIAEKVGAVYVMGGALATPGNIGPATEVVTEANVRLDVEACKEVLESQLPLVLVGLDVTRKHYLPMKIMNGGIKLAQRALCSFTRR